MLILAILALAVSADGYYIESRPEPRMDNNWLKRMCEQNGANYAQVENAAMDFYRCMEVSVQVRSMEQDINEAYVTKSYDSFNRVFRKYCQKTPALKACYHTLMEVAAPCLGSGNQDFATVSIDMNDQLLDYMCENDGYIITKFIMEDGPKCFGDNSYEIMMCAERSRNSLMYTSMHQNISFSTLQDMYDGLLNCTLQSIASCDNPILSDIIGNVFDVIRQSISQGDMKNISSNSQRKSNKASSTVAVAFNADIDI